MLSVPALINAIIDALTADTLAAAVMEPPVAGGPHAGAGGLALVPGHALGHVGHAAVYCHLKYFFVLYNIISFSIPVYLITVLYCTSNGINILRIYGDGVLDDGEEGGHVNVHGEGHHGPSTLGIILVCQGLEQGWTVGIKILTKMISMIRIR